MLALGCLCYLVIRPNPTPPAVPLVSDRLSRPLAVTLLGLAGSASGALYAILRFPPDKAALNLVYFVPIVFPFVTFLLERARSLRETTPWSCVPDSIVVVLAMWRVIGDVPLLSGHALFLSYAALTCRSRITRFAAILVLLETAWLKLIVWHEPVSLGLGVALGSCFALVHLWLRRREPANPVVTGQPN